MLVRRVSRVGLVIGIALASVFVTACSSSDNASSTSSDRTDAGNDNDGGDTAPVPGDATGAPITEGVANQWTWVDFPDSSCANGKPTGIGINVGTSKRVVLFFEGGGACWNQLTCYSAGTATYIQSGFGKDEFVAEKKSFDGNTIFDRTSATNPFKDDSIVYIPYCTGDVHAGDKEQDYGGIKTKHFGRRNVAAFLNRIAPTFPDASRVFVTGSSAGGFGTMVNYWRVAKAFGSAVRVDLVDDSGPPFPNDQIGYLSDWADAWDLFGALPPGCAECKSDLTASISYYATTYPKSRFSLLSYDQDGTISQFYGLDGAAFQTALTGIVSSRYNAPNAKAFVVKGKQHTMLRTLGVTSGAANTTLSAWLTSQTSDSADWANVTP
ncbi:hypothetical protein AKJ09_09799 [Labilithrix luteola]|uniref:Pectinacetylesterase n=1 Tax=Labilithrix luteola TaxID=1391654 RepID=A0A0K1QBH3_9BACT|nr:pectin acetylesterase-family hydrolase [Labilithrix luteola]AKV03136.1 hypothetical protein AKJ09_09799 [Labilithrix luteola]